MGKKRDYINFLTKQLDLFAENEVKLEKERDELIRERDFLADQVNKLESVIDDKQSVIDKVDFDSLPMHHFLGIT